MPTVKFTNLNRLTLCRKIFFAGAMSIFFFGVKSIAQNTGAFSKARTYYFSPSGNDNDKGTKKNPWQTIQKLNTIHLGPGDAALFEGGQTFNGTIQIDSADAGNALNPVLISSYGNGYAIISSGHTSAITISRTKYLSVKNLRLIGAGRKDGNVKDGISISDSRYIVTDSLDVSGFQKAGLLVYSSADITITHVYAHENGAAGIAAEGMFGQKACTGIYIGFCRAENNPGDPTNLTNQSGNGIIVGHCRKVTIEYCVATNNGWDMPRIGNGPVGIWGYEADSLVIQHCLAYRNKTSDGGADGGGFDLDGGVTNSIVQYCLSYENQGAGYCIFQYWGASPWYNNVFRYNISKDDGLVSDGRAGVYVWNSSGDANQFYNCLFYNNTIYNTKRAAISYSEKSERKDFSFYNNIFIAQDSLIKGGKGIDIFLANDWWSVTKQFNIERVYDLTTWAQRNKQEMINGKIIGLNIDPGFKNPDDTMPTSPYALKLFDQYNIPGNSALRNSGLDLHLLYGIDTGNLDFNQQPAPAKGIGACF